MHITCKKTQLKLQLLHRVLIFFFFFNIFYTSSLYFFQPTCFGYEYFSAVDALDDNGFPDVEIFQEYFSDLSDDKLAVQLTDLVTSCVEPVRVNNNSSSKKKMGYVLYLSTYLYIIYDRGKERVTYTLLQV